ncbi:hypothetical protein DWG18_14725 [Lysobacter sp. TY2-98]|uniref:hypothetical protein n=1 Tax=Lysobacter sp. TY2-98 TaxID=2290922 RepID=UPI000E1FB9D4|nr:hypothetical protein [Lysobacter sp. TY2-98]AXK73410.1 hypothetical protein DWG18_14725 [Lysobacter sp. TY2-98]
MLALALTGCGAVDTMKEGFTHSQEVAADLEKSVGKKPQVGFNGANGTLTNVTVMFDGIPPGPSNEQIARLSRDAIATRFKQAPKQVTISYVLSE